jgi:hypothetical protein
MINMKKVVLLSGVILIFAVMSGCSENTKPPTIPSTNTPVSTAASISTTTPESTSDTPTIQQSMKDTESIVYKNTKYNFNLKLPKSWEGTYYVKDDPVTPGNNIDFFSKDHPNYDVLFSIFIWSKDYWIKHEEEVKGQIPISKIGEKSDKVYLFVSQPTIQSNSEDEKLKAAYESMVKDINTILASFAFEK